MGRVHHFRAASVGIACSKAADWLTLGLIEYGSSATPACAAVLLFHVERERHFCQPPDRTAHGDTRIVSRFRHGVIEPT
jgi:hypothetical protein